jgi:CubicO group peptidase (beta-lactamase class C family)
MTFPHQALTAALEARLRATQHAERLPAVAAAIARDGTMLFEGGAGEPQPTTGTQFRIGSITKTFTAALVMQLRDEGRLRLDDRLDLYISDTVAGHLTLRMLLSHTSGLTAEPAGPFWEATGRTRDEVVGGLRDEDLVLKPGQAFHYSNVGFALLGQVVEHLREQSWADALRTRILEPLGLTRTTYAPTAPFAQGWRVHPFASTLTAEPHADTGAMAPAGQIWSTPGDVVRWGQFLAAPVPEVLHPDTVEEMATPVVFADPDHWTFAYGLGLGIARHGERLLVGHGGSMPGFSANLSVARRERVVGAIVTNAWGGRQGTFLQDAIDAALQQPAEQAPWHTEPVPDEIAGLLGTWWYRGLPLVLAYRQGALHLDLPNNLGTRARLDMIDRNTFRAASGDMRGETLRVMRDDAGVASVLDINTWLLTRTHDDPRGGP